MLLCDSPCRCKQASDARDLSTLYPESYAQNPSPTCASCLFPLCGHSGDGVSFVTSASVIRDNQDPGQNPRIEGKQKKKFRGVIDVVEYVRWCIDLQKGDTGAKKGHQDKTWMEGLMMKEHVD